MKNLSTGTGLALLAGAALAYPFVSSFAPNANASAVTAAAAVTTAATGQTTPTIVWYGVARYAGSVTIARAWSNGRVEVRNANSFDVNIGNGTYCTGWTNGAPECNTTWHVVSDPAQGLTYRSDINFDEQVNGADLGQLLADWGNAPRQDIPPSDCPLALINP